MAKKSKVKEAPKPELSDKTLRKRETGVSNIAMANKFLEDNKLTNSGSPNVAILLSAANQLDDFAKMMMTETQYTTLTEKLRRTMAKATDAIQKDIDRKDSRSTTARHQMQYGTIAAESLGLLDLNLLSDNLRQVVADYLFDTHGIEIEDYEPRKRKL